MPLNFPSSPTVGQTYTDDNSVVWQFDGTVWNVVTGSTKKFFNGAKVEFTTNYNLSSTNSAVAWDAEGYDTNQYWNSATPARITINQTGYYTVNLLLFASSLGAGYNISLKKNGSTVITSGTLSPNQSAEYYETLVLNAGDYLELYADETSSVGALTTSSFIEIEQAGLGVGVGVNSYAAFSGVRVELSSAFNTTATPTAIAWSSTEFDTNANAEALTYWSAGTPSRITVKVTAYYSIQAYIKNGATGSNYTLTLKKNGTTDLSTNTGLNPNDQAWIEETFYFTANDYIELFVSDAGASGSVTAETHMEVIRQGY